MAQQIIHRLCIIGVGLIGGSLARALKKAGVVGEVVGTGRDISHLEKAKDLGVIDHFEMDISLAVKNCDMVVLAVPLGAMQSVFEQIAPVITDDMVITDVGSAKASVVKSAQAAFKSIPETFVPGHPIAGTEKKMVLKLRLLNSMKTAVLLLHHWKQVHLLPSQKYVICGKRVALKLLKQPLSIMMKF